MTCSKKYRDLVVTTDGDTPENPYGLYPTPFDYEDWRALASRLLIRTKVHLDRLKDAEKNTEQTVAYNGFVEEYNGLVERYEALPDPFFGTFHESDTRQSIGLATTLSVDAVCLMEVVDKSLAAVGMKVPGEHAPVKPNTPPGETGTKLGLVLLAGGVAYLLWRSSK